jgi:hypothetical protein
MIEETWFLLYGGESADGLGPGRYETRTTDEEVAKRHLERIRENPYSTGKVMVITDTTIRMLS